MCDLLKTVIEAAPSANGINKQTHVVLFFKFLRGWAEQEEELKTQKYGHHAAQQHSNTSTSHLHVVRSAKEGKGEKKRDEWEVWREEE